MAHYYSDEMSEYADQMEEFARRYGYRDTDHLMSHLRRVTQAMERLYDLGLNPAQAGADLPPVLRREHLNEFLALKGAQRRAAVAAQPAKPRLRWRAAAAVAGAVCAHKLTWR